MNNLFLPIIALLAGAAIATQASLNAQLGVIVKNSMFATAVAFFSSFIFTLVAFMFIAGEIPNTAEIRAVPLYLWFSGGLLSTFGVGVFYWLIPKMGVGPMISFALTGQLLLAMIAGHFGWFKLPVTPMTLPKLFGATLLILGIILTNRG